MSTSMGPRSSGADVTRRPVLASYDDYLDAQKAVDTLSDNGFPVQNTAIVGVDVRIVESVLGRLTWGKAAMSGMFSGAWFGVLIGLFVGLFSSTTGSLFPLVGLGLLYGAAFSIVWGLVSHALTGGKRDFVSRQQLQAARYEVRCDQSVIGDARKILGLGGSWPPDVPASGETSPTVSDTARDVADTIKDGVESARDGVPPASA